MGTGTDRNYCTYGDETGGAGPLTADSRYGQLDSRRLREQWLDRSQRPATATGWRELAPGVYGDGNQRVSAENGHIVIYNYGTITIEQCGRDARQANGGYDWRNGEGSQNYDWRRYLTPNQLRQGYPPMQGPQPGYNDFSEEGYARWQAESRRRLYEQNLAQRYFSQGAYPEQLYGPQAMGVPPNPYYQQFYAQPNPGVALLSALGRLGIAIQLGRSHVSPYLAFGGGNNWGSGYYGNYNYRYPPGYVPPNYGYAPTSYSGDYAGDYYPSYEYSGTQYVPNTAYAWQNATAAAMNYARRPYATLPPGYYAQTAQNWNSDYSYN
jgi:hypothetical protein